MENGFEYYDAQEADINMYGVIKIIKKIVTTLGVELIISAIANGKSQFNIGKLKINCDIDDDNTVYAKIGLK